MHISDQGITLDETGLTVDRSRIDRMIPPADAHLRKIHPSTALARCDALATELAFAYRRLASSRTPSFPDDLFMTDCGQLLEVATDALDTLRRLSLFADVRDNGETCRPRSQSSSVACQTS